MIFPIELFLLSIHIFYFDCFPIIFTVSRPPVLLSAVSRRFAIRGSCRRTCLFREFCNCSSASSILRLLQVLKDHVSPLRTASAQHPLIGNASKPFQSLLCLIGTLYVEQQPLTINIFPTFVSALVRFLHFILIFKASLRLSLCHHHNR